MTNSSSSSIAFPFPFLEVSMFPGYGWCQGPFFFEADIQPDAKLAGRTADNTPLHIFEDEAIHRVFTFPCGGAWGEVHTIVGAYAMLDEVGSAVP
jgi:hypothetical protein